MVSYSVIYTVSQTYVISSLQSAGHRVPLVNIQTSVQPRLSVNFNVLAVYPALYSQMVHVLRNVQQVPLFRPRIT